LAGDFDGVVAEPFKRAGDQTHFEQDRSAQVGRGQLGGETGM